MQDTSIEIVGPSSIDPTPYVTSVFDFVALNFSPITKSFMGILIGLSIPVSIFLFIAIIITVERLKLIRKRESEIYDAKVDMGYSEVIAEPSHGNVLMARKWHTVQTHVESPNANDWRQAVLEADIILGELLTMLGYRGEGIGEQLKRATKADFKSLDEAWEAHKIRNELAHSGSDYPFNQYEARRVIQLYRKVFEEFFHI
ncbi:MAG: hypothetical protein Q7S72_01865 [Candidatus Taylorbacteria bacterium]|nr:hypothetical protein [Candidatus Taylorbacteria bacterium]